MARYKRRCRNDIEKGGRRYGIDDAQAFEFNLSTNSENHWIAVTFPEQLLSGAKVTNL